MREILRDYLDPVFNILNYRIFTLGEAQITPLNIIYLIVLTGLLFWLSNKFKNIFVERVLGKTHLDLGARVAIGTIIRYVVLLVGFLIIVQTVGINLTTLNVLAGAVGIGVGFGLQNVASNFISGLIILFERPVKVGDRIQVGDVDGKVTGIGARSTTVRTNDNITIIVPNSKFIEENVVNWSFANQSVRFRVPVGVAYDSDLNLVKKLLLEVAEENADVLREPKAAVRLIEFGDSAINLELWVWTKEKLQRKTVFISALNFAIWEKFRTNDIEIPFPQTDLHIKTGRVKVKNNGNAVDEQEPDGFNELVFEENEAEN
ncbi:MAG TPA: mechanosensitive ion channel domain-containing protein [Pyrinomonadaceae bacterium]|nr:mechanosensitive ion channel domain-containing protein [Pyrinomonadaceae bacterium]